jgi:hypothetical protein
VLPRCLFLYAAGAHDDGCLLEPVLRGSEYLSDRSAPPGSLKVALTILKACKRIIVTGGTTRDPMSAFDAVDGSSTGIAMRHIAVVIREQPMSLIGTKQTF